MLQFRGGPALSPFRIQKLLIALREKLPSVSGLAAEYRYFVDAEANLGEQERGLLVRLLDDEA
ncbi:MAG: hypothetical protein ACRESC_05825, partial [Gammaproteobacteria bacterium]